MKTGIEFRPIDMADVTNLGLLAQKLHEMKYEVVVVLESGTKAHEVFENRFSDLRVVVHGRNLLEEYSDIVVVSTVYTELSANAARNARIAIQLQEQPGWRASDWKNVPLKSVCVVSDAAALLTRKKWGAGATDMPMPRTGMPSMDAVAKEVARLDRCEVRSRIGVETDEFLVLSAGGSSNAPEMARMVSGLPINALVYPSIHPGASDGDKAAYWTELEQPEIKLTPVEAMFAADVTIGPIISTMLEQCCALGNTPIAVATPAVLKDLEKISGLKSAAEHPLVQANLVAVAESADDVCGLVDQAMRGELRLAEMQPLDGRNTERAVDAILAYA